MSLVCEEWCGQSDQFCSFIEKSNQKVNSFHAPSVSLIETDAKKFLVVLKNSALKKLQWLTVMKWQYLVLHFDYSPVPNGAQPCIDITEALKPPSLASR